MGALFGRQVRITLGEKNGPGDRYDNLRVTFDLEKTISNKPNSGVIEVYNLSVESTDFLVELEDDLYTILETQYNDGWGVLFEGNVKKVTSDMQGAERVLKLEIGDGNKAINKVFTNRSFSKGFDLKKLAETLVDEIKSTASTAISQATQGSLDLLSGKKIKSGETISGSTSKALTRILRANGLDFSVQNDEIQIIPLNGSAGEGSALLTPTTGLVGSPLFVDKGVQVRALIQSNKFIPGYTFELQSRDIEGEFVIKKVKFTGDNWGADWTATIYGERL